MNFFFFVGDMWQRFWVFDAFLLYPLIHGGLNWPLRIINDFKGPGQTVQRIEIWQYAVMGWCVHAFKWNQLESAQIKYLQKSIPK